MGWYPPRVPGIDHGSYPSCVHEDWPHPEEEVQIRPDFRATGNWHFRERAESVCLGYHYIVKFLMMLLIKHVTSSVLVEFHSLDQSQGPCFKSIIYRFQPSERQQLELKCHRNRPICSNPGYLFLVRLVRYV